MPTATFASETRASRYTAEQAWNDLERLQLIPPQRLGAAERGWLEAGGRGAADAEELGRWLVAHGFVTELVAAMLKDRRLDHLALDGYTLCDTIRSGPFAGAYLGVDPRQRCVAVEFLAANTRDAALVADFREVARKAAGVHHPNVGRTLGHGQAHGLHYVVLKYYEGDSLAEVVHRRGRIAYASAARIFSNALAGLLFLHEKQVPAGDLTLADLMLTVTGSGEKAQRTVKIVNAGFRRRLFDAAVVGRDVAAAAPEAAGEFRFEPDRTTSNPEADVFRLGCCFYECLTGKPPFAADLMLGPDRPAAPVRELAPDVPATLARLVEEMIDPVPSQRVKGAEAAKWLRNFIATMDEAEAHKPEETAPAPVATVPAAAPAPAASAPAPTPRKDDETAVMGAEVPEQQPPSRKKAAGRSRPAPADRGKVVLLGHEFKFQERDLVLVGVGAFGLILITLAIRTIIGWNFANIFFLLSGGALTCLVEWTVRWRRQMKELAAEAKAPKAKSGKEEVFEGEPVEGEPVPAQAAA